MTASANIARTQEIQIRITDISSLRRKLGGAAVQNPWRRKFRLKALACLEGESPETFSLDHFLENVHLKSLGNTQKSLKAFSLLVMA